MPYNCIMASSPSAAYENSRLLTQPAVNHFLCGGDEIRTDIISGNNFGLKCYK